MAQFSDVPTEIISHIFSFVIISDFPNLCLVNKFIRSLAEPFLYSAIILQWEYRSQIPPIIPLLRTLLQRPELFAYIDTVSMHGQTFMDGHPKPALDISSTPLEPFITAIEKTQMPYINLWVNKLRLGSMDALGGLLIAYLSKTRRLAINHNFISGFEIIGKVLQSKIYGQQPQAQSQLVQTVGQLPKFERLNHMIYIMEESDVNLNHNQIFTDSISLFYIPTVRSLRVRLSNPPIFRWPAGEPNLNNLTSLEIHWFHTPFLAKILALTHNLRYLFWNWEYHATISWDPWKTSTLDLDEITITLSYVKNTLEILYFRLDIGGGGLPDADPKINILGSLHGLRDFKRLTYLEIPFIFLAGVGPRPQPLELHLPDNLEVLCFTLTKLKCRRNTVEWSMSRRRSREDPLDDVVRFDSVFS